VTAHPLCLVLATLVTAAPEADDGRIGGRVVNATRGDSPVAGADVYLQTRVDGEFTVVARATTSSEGLFLFEGLPTDQGLIFLPGASRDGIHYPGPRVALTPDRREAQVVVKVHESTTGPSPLVLRDFEVRLVPEPGALRVTERLVIENPEPATYVGPPAEGGSEPVTLRLGVSPEFERVTFDQEFYGRQFSVAGGALVTGLPWTPGRRELRYTYVLRNDGRSHVWTRPLDLPCQHVRLSVSTDAPDGVSCSLGAPGRSHDGTVTFETDGRPLPSGLVVKVDLGRLPVPAMTYARWGVLGLLVVAIAGSSLVAARRRRAVDRRATRKARRRDARRARVPA
jgi:hypothetical protein